jgi:hypothetical protein
MATPRCAGLPELPTGGHAATLAALNLVARFLPSQSDASPRRPKLQRVFAEAGHIAGAANASLLRWLSRPQQPAVPKILHQTWRSCTLPRRQRAWREECRRVLSGSHWAMQLHTDEDNRAFIAREFPAYLGMYDSYDVHIKRVDAVRYFYLYRYGGVYMDLDFTCLQPLERTPLTPGHVTMGFQRGSIHDPESVANAFIAAPPRHPFLAVVIHHLNSTAGLRQRGKIHPLQATGCAFLTRMVRLWQETFGDTAPGGGLRIGHPRGLAWGGANRTKLFGQAMSVYLMPRIYNSDWMATGPTSHPCGCDQARGCTTRGELANCSKSPLLRNAVVTTFWTHTWLSQMRDEVRAKGGDV